MRKTNAYPHLSVFIEDDMPRLRLSKKWDKLDEGDRHFHLTQLKRILEVEIGDLEEKFEQELYGDLG